MKQKKELAADANILVRAVFGVRVRSLLEASQGTTTFRSPDICFADAARHLPAIAMRRGVDPAIAFSILNDVSRIIHVVDRSNYARFEAASRERISSRDEEDWPVVATALLLHCPIWTEDKDFFGCGVPTWMSSTVDIYLRDI